MRNEYDDETSTASDEDIFSSSGEEESESSEEMNNSDKSKEEDPWGVLIHEAAVGLRTKHNELVQSFQNGGVSETDAKKQAFSEILPDPKEIGKYLFGSSEMDDANERDPVHRKIVKTKDAFVDEDDFDPDEALTTAIKRKGNLFWNVC